MPATVRVRKRRVHFKKKTIRQFNNRNEMKFNTNINSSQSEPICAIIQNRNRLFSSVARFTEKLFKKVNNFDMLVIGLIARSVAVMQCISFKEKHSPKGSRFPLHLFAKMFEILFINWKLSVNRNRLKTRSKWVHTSVSLVII